MPTAWTAVSDLKPKMFHSNVKLRLIRAYDLVSFHNAGEVYARECIFHDNEGKRVLAIFQKEDFPLFNPALKEGKLMRVSNSAVISNNKPTISPFKFKLSFGKRTIVAETFDDQFPNLCFNFMSFEEVNAITDFDNTPMFDLIGALILEEPAVTKPINGKDTLIMDVYLENLEGTRVACTLWSKYASDMMKFVEKGPKQPVIVVMQFCKAGKYNGMLKASTFFNDSKIIINENIQEIQSFKERYISTRSFEKKTLSLCLSTCTFQGTPSTIKLRTIEEVNQRKEGGRFWICGSIADIDNRGGWTYTSCKGCPRKKCPSESAIPCSFCKAEGVMLRYRLKLHVVDDTGNLSLILWDKHCLRIFGKKAEQLEEYGELPYEIEELLEKKMMFEIEVSKSNASLYEDNFSVSQVSSDPAFIEKYSQQTPNTQESVSHVKNKAVMVGQSEFISSGSGKEDDQGSSHINLGEEKKTYKEEKTCLKRDLMGEFEAGEEENTKRAKISPNDENH